MRLPGQDVRPVFIDRYDVGVGLSCILEDGITVKGDREEVAIGPGG